MFRLNYFLSSNTLWKNRLVRIKVGVNEKNYIVSSCMVFSRKVGQIVS